MQKAITKIHEHFGNDFENINFQFQFFKLNFLSALKTSYELLIGFYVRKTRISVLSKVLLVQICRHEYLRSQKLSLYISIPRIQCTFSVVCFRYFFKIFNFFFRSHFFGQTGTPKHIAFKLPPILLFFRMQSRCGQFVK